MKAKYQVPTTELITLEAGYLCQDSQIFSGSTANGGEEITPITAPKRRVVF